VLASGRVQNALVPSLEGHRGWSSGGHEEPRYPPVSSRIRSELDTDRRQMMVKGENSLKSASFLLKCLFPRHC